MLSINEGVRTWAHFYAASGSINYSAILEDNLAELLKFKVHTPSNSTFE